MKLWSAWHGVGKNHGYPGSYLTHVKLCVGAISYYVNVIIVVVRQSSRVPQLASRGPTLCLTIMAKS